METRDDLIERYIAARKQEDYAAMAEILIQLRELDFAKLTKLYISEVETKNRTKKPKCRCYINAKYNSRTAWRTGKLPKPCPVPGHDEDIKKPLDK